MGRPPWSFRVLETPASYKAFLWHTRERKEGPMPRRAQPILVGILLVGLTGVSNPAPAASHKGHKGHRASPGHKGHRAAQGQKGRTGHRGHRGHQGHRTASAPKCWNCNMQHSTRKSKATPRRLVVSGRTYYCCTWCGPHFKKQAKS